MQYLIVLIPWVKAWDIHFASIVIKLQQSITDQGFFQVLYHITVFVFQIEFVKGRRLFLTLKTWRNQQGLCRALWSRAEPGWGTMRQSTRKISVFGLWESLTLAWNQSSFVNHCTIYELRSLLGVLFTFVYVVSGLNRLQ